jgi:hypothetical protein
VLVDVNSQLINGKKDTFDQLCIISTKIRLAFYANQCGNCIALQVIYRQTVYCLERSAFDISATELLGSGNHNL